MANVRLYIGQGMKKNLSDYSKHPGNGDFVRVMTGHLVINEDFDLEDGKLQVEPGALCTLNAGIILYCCHITNYGTFYKLGTIKCGGLTFPARILDVLHWIDMHLWLDPDHVLDGGHIL